MKLTITDKVFVPVSNHKESTHWVVDTIEKNGDSYFTKEETNKYVLSKEEIEKVVSDAIKFGISKQSSFEIGGGKNIKLIDLTNEFLNSIL